MNSIAILVARILLALLFLVSAFRQAIYRHGVEQEMAAHGMTGTPFFLGCAILIELTGGLSLILGYATLWGALELVAFTLAATFIYYRRIVDRDKLNHVLKNLAITAGLLMIAAVGPGTIGIGGATLPR
jgi:putative oxidoreductase